MRGAREDMRFTIREEGTPRGLLDVQRCWCSIQHAVPRQLLNQQRRAYMRGEKQAGIYCPLGHKWVFTKEKDPVLGDDVSVAPESAP